MQVASWKLQAWSHWHRPWSTMHPAWLAADPRLPAAGADDWALQLHYPAWCERLGLAPALQSFDDSTWWQLLALPNGAFDEAVRRVGLTLMFAAEPRLRLQRQAGNDVAVVRWALGRAPFVPDAVADVVRRAGLPASAPSHAALALHVCLQEIPDLHRRLRLRFDPADLLPAETTSPRATDGVRTWLSTLWSGGTRAALKERLS